MPNLPPCCSVHRAYKSFKQQSDLRTHWKSARWLSISGGAGVIEHTATAALMAKNTCPSGSDGWKQHIRTWHEATRCCCCVSIHAWCCYSHAMPLVPSTWLDLKMSTQSATKPEAHNVLKHCETRTEPQRKSQHAQKIWWCLDMWFSRYPCGQTDKQICTPQILITAPQLQMYGDKPPTDTDAANQADTAIYYSCITELGDIRFRNLDSDT